MLAIAPLVRADEKEAASFVTARVVKVSNDESGNELNSIVVSNSHESRTIRATIRWITIARERENDITLKPGQEKILAHDQINARDVRVVAARFRD